MLSFNGNITLIRYTHAGDKQLTSLFPKIIADYKLNVKIIACVYLQTHKNSLLSGRLNFEFKLTVQREFYCYCKFPSFLSSS